MPCLIELEEAYRSRAPRPAFAAEVDDLLRAVRRPPDAALSSRALRRVAAAAGRAST